MSQRRMRRRKCRLLKKSVSADGAEEIIIDSTVQTVIQQHVVEHAEHNKAHKKLWSSTAPVSDSRRLDKCLVSGHSQLRKRERG